MAVLTERWLAALSDYVAQHLGLRFPRDRWPDLARGTASAARDAGFLDEAAYVQRLLSTPASRAQIETLASQLTVGETYFLREPRVFHVLETIVLPELIRAGRPGQPLRIWSAGCATGEEAYSIAILLSRLLPDLTDRDLTILATDINPRFLQKAAEGVFSEWSFRGTTPEFRERYFLARGSNQFELLPRLKKRVTFAYLNLVDDVYPSLTNGTNGLDLIFCRNVLMYLTEGVAGRVVRELHRSLADGGWLIVGGGELSHTLFTGFTAVDLDGAMLYRKTAVHPEAPVLAPAWQWEAPSAAMPNLEGSPAPLPVEDAPPPPRPYELALALSAAGRYDEAAAHLQDALTAAPTETPLMALLARVYANQGRLPEALAWCERALTGDRLNPGHHFLHAMLLQEQGMESAAKQSLRRTLYLDQGYVMAHVSLAHLALRTDRESEARKHFANALTLLEAYPTEAPLPESEGMTAGRLAHVIRSTMEGSRLT